MSGKEKRKQSIGKGFVIASSDGEEEEEWTDAVGSGLWWAAWWAGVSPVG